jgi:hypothetical protein
LNTIISDSRERSGGIDELPSGALQAASVPQWIR